MSHYKRKIEGLDPERGNDWYIFPDKLSVLHEMPIESANETICAYYRWIRGENEEDVKAQIKDATAKIIFAVVVAAHKNRVKEYIDKCNKSIPNKYKKRNKRTKGERRLTSVNQKEKDKDMFSKKESLRDTSFLENAVDRRVAGDCAESAPASADNLERHDVPQEEKNETSYAILDALGLLGEED